VTSFATIAATDGNASRWIRRETLPRPYSMRTAAIEPMTVHFRNWRRVGLNPCGNFARTSTRR